jgi:hypothetical protein
VSPFGGKKLSALKKDLQAAAKRCIMEAQENTERMIVLTKNFDIVEFRRILHELFMDLADWLRGLKK